MSYFYAMQRANGKWFTVRDNDSVRVPVFLSSSEAMQARTRTRGMMFYKPVIFDAHALKALAAIKEITICYWLVSNAKRELRHGQPLTSEEMAKLLKEERSKQKDSINV